jgi:3',5'-cyclic AMP phosphodiesterase CpdA
MRTIAQISDLHFGRHDPAVVEALAGILNGPEVDLVVVSGDLTQRARHAEFSAARSFLERIRAPKLIVPGNHDIPLYGLHRRLFSPLAKFDRTVRPAGVADATYRDEEIAVLGLNTARRFTGKNGRVSSEQIARIVATFGDLAPGCLKIVVTHHPISAPARSADAELVWRSDAALRAVRSSGVHVLLSGHHHQASSGAVPAETLEHASVLAVHAGTATSDRLRNAEANSFNLIATDGWELTVTVMEYRDDTFRERDAAGFVFSDGRWR